MDDKCKKASEFLKILVDNMVNEKILKADSLQKTWKNIVGDKIFSHSKLIDISSGNLVIETDHPGWSQQILFKKNKIIESVNNLFPESKVRNIFIRVKSKDKNNLLSDEDGSKGDFSSEISYIKEEDDAFNSELCDSVDEKEILFNQFQKLRKTLEMNESGSKKGFNS